MPCDEEVVTVTVPPTAIADAIGAKSIQSWNGAVATDYGLVFVRPPFVRFV